MTKAPSWQNEPKESAKCTTLDLGWWSFFRRVQGSCLKWNNMSQKITGQKCCRKILLIILMIMWQNVLLTITITIIIITIIIIIVIILVATVVVVIKNLMIIDNEKNKPQTTSAGPSIFATANILPNSTPCGCIRGPVPQPGDSWVKAWKPYVENPKDKKRKKHLWSAALNTGHEMPIICKWMYSKWLCTPCHVIIYIWFLYRR